MSKHELRKKFWEAAQEASKEVEEWPEWMRLGSMIQPLEIKPKIVKKDK